MQAQFRCLLLGTRISCGPGTKARRPHRNGSAPERESPVRTAQPLTSRRCGAKSMPSSGRSAERKRAHRVPGYQGRCCPQTGQPQAITEGRLVPVNSIIIADLLFPQMLCKSKRTCARCVLRRSSQDRPVDLRNGGRPGQHRSTLQLIAQPVHEQGCALGPGSLCRAGLPVSFDGGRDFRGNHLPAGLPPSIGAHELGAGPKD